MQSSDRAEAIAAEVRAELARQRKTQREVGAILGLPQNSVYMRLSGKTSFRAEELAALADGLGVSVELFLRTSARAA